MVRVAKIGKNAELEAAIESEMKRARAALDKLDAAEDAADDPPDARRAECEQNVKRIGASLVAYAAKHDGAYPSSMEDLVDSGELDEVPVSPFAADKESPDYVLTLPGFPGVASRDGATTIVVRCQHAGPDGKVTVGFADGHVESAPADALAKSYDAAKSTPRKWSDPTGTYSTEATFVEFAAGGVTLKKADGRVITVPYARLRQADLDYLRKLNEYVSEEAP